MLTSYSPITPTFRRQQRSIKEEGHEQRFRETLDLRPAQDWIGSRSPIPLAVPSDSYGRSIEVRLTRSSVAPEEDALEAAGGSYPFASIAGPQSEQEQRQHRTAASPHSITFYAW